MTNALFNRNSIFLIYGIPALIILICVSIGSSSLISQYSEFAFAITFDLTISAPFFYFLLIRGTSIPKITIIPVFGIGVLVGSLLLPTQQQLYLDLVKQWAIPVVELAILFYIGFVAYKSFKILKTYKNENPDVYTVLRLACAGIVNGFVSPGLLINSVLTQTDRKPLSLKWYSEALACEAAMIYYAFIGWKKLKPDENQYTYHKKSGKISLLGTIIFLILAETVVLHVLLAYWSVIAAWILTALSIYFVIQIFAHIKAIFQRPIEIFGNKLIVRYGLFGDTEIDLDNIEKIELSSIKPEDESGLKQVSFLGELEQFNTIIRLKNKETFRGFYGIKSKYKTLLLYVDENTRLKKLVESYESC